MRQISLLIVLLVFIACNNDENPVISVNAKEFLDEVTDIMKANSINRKTIDWEDFDNKVFEKASRAQSLEDTYPAISLAITLLKDNHSSFLTRKAMLYEIKQ